MDGDDLHVLDTVLDWHASGDRFHLATVLRTWGASPRPPGSWMAWRDDGAIVGSVSGGCIEDELLYRWRHGEFEQTAPRRVVFGGPDDPGARPLRLPCGAVIELLIEVAPDPGHLHALRDGIVAGRLMARRVDIESGRCAASAAAADAGFSFGAGVVSSVHGPRWRLFIVGACDIGRHLASMAPALGFVVSVCDPREEYRAVWDLDALPVLADMPDDALLAWLPDTRSAVVTVSHDPKIDDLALIDALKSPAFYIAAVGSLVTSAQRRERLALFDLSAHEIARLHAPAGLPIGSRTPAEIALSILAELVAERGHASAAGRATEVRATACAAATVGSHP